MVSHIFYFTHIALSYLHFLKSQQKCHDQGKLYSFTYLLFGNPFSHLFVQCRLKGAGEEQSKKDLGKSQQMAPESSEDGRKILLTVTVRQFEQGSEMRKHDKPRKKQMQEGCKHILSGLLFPTKQKGWAAISPSFTCLYPCPFHLFHVFPNHI